MAPPHIRNPGPELREPIDDEVVVGAQAAGGLGEAPGPGLLGRAVGRWDPRGRLPVWRALAARGGGAPGRRGVLGRRLGRRLPGLRARVPDRRRLRPGRGGQPPGRTGRGRAVPQGGCEVHLQDAGERGRLRPRPEAGGQPGGGGLRLPPPLAGLPAAAPRARGLHDLQPPDVHLPRGGPGDRDRGELLRVGHEGCLLRRRPSPQGLLGGLGVRRREDSREVEHRDRVGCHAHLFTSDLCLLGDEQMAAVPHAPDDLQARAAVQARRVPAPARRRRRPGLPAAFTVILGLFLVVVYAASLAQWWQYVNMALDDSEARQAWCGVYINSNGTKTAGFQAHRRCSALNSEYEPWWTEAEFSGYRSCDVWDCSAGPVTPPRYAPGVQSIGSLFWRVLLAGLVLAICLWPFVTGLVFSFLSVAGQCVAFLLLVLSVQFRVYTPLTGQRLLGTFEIDEVEWYYFVGISLMLTYLAIPLHNHTGSFWHQYYRRTLRLNFLEGGQDRSLAEVQKSPWCPMLLLTATVNDYKSVGDRSKANTEEISFSALHTGSYKMGYYATPAWRKLAHVTAITAAACLDTITISMTKRTRYRFWSEMLNLSWGDYIAFTEGPWWYRRLPCLLLYIVYQTLLTVGFQLSRSEMSCGFSYSCLVAAMMLAVTVLFLSFFTFARGLGFLAHDQLLRRFHQVTRYYYLGGRSAVPDGVRGAPGLVYVTDGGVSDCTGIVQLMRRRRRHILLVLAAADPFDELGVLRTAMDVAVSEKIGNFYDLSDERRHVKILLEEYRSREDWTYLELGIRYGWRFEGSGALGRLVVVKNRLPRTGRHEQQVCRPLLTEERICGEADTDDDALSSDDPLSKMREVDLGGLGCCDCCHTHSANCGGKFPHLGFTGYLWLTPTLFTASAASGTPSPRTGSRRSGRGCGSPGAGLAEAGQATSRGELPRLNAGIGEPSRRGC
ncbi:unnamed protein product, partial [Prorocentrum cordatum]